MVPTPPRVSDRVCDGHSPQRMMAAGGMRERPNRTVSKTVVSFGHRGFKSHSLRRSGTLSRVPDSFTWASNAISPKPQALQARLRELALSDGIIRRDSSGAGAPGVSRRCRPVRPIGRTRRSSWPFRSWPFRSWPTRKGKQAPRPTLIRRSSTTGLAEKLGGWRPG